VLPSCQDRLNVFASDAGLSVSQLLSEDIPKGALAWTYKKGKHLFTPEKEKSLLSQMQKLHQWYMDAIKREQEMILMKVIKEHYLGEDEIHIHFEELFQLVNQDAFDKYLVSCYCL
jgi:hypothetical protein